MPLPAFPGAQGWGADTPGGRGGQVLFVTNLNDAGAGSFRDAMLQTFPRIIVFRVSGTIFLQSDIVLTTAHSYLTVAGQTAPGDGICIAQNNIALGVNQDPGQAFHDGIFRHLRIRLGTGAADPGTADCFQIFTGSHHIILDHCSMTWAIDETMSIFGENCSDITLQWCIFAESSETGHPSGVHNYGPQFSGAPTATISRITLHHCYFSNNHIRNPHCVVGDYELINNVAYNNYKDLDLEQRGDYVNGPNVDCINCYFKQGPDSKGGTIPGASTLPNDIILTNANPPLSEPCRIYMAGNIAVDVNDQLCAYFDPGDQTTLLDIDPGTTYEIKSAPQLSPSPFPVTTQDATTAKDLVLADVGASPRDAIDARLINEFQTGTGQHGITGTWPTLNTSGVPTDSDSDGMPDAWETTYGFNPNSAADANLDANGDGYTNIEEWLNGTNPLSPTELYGKPGTPAPGIPSGGSVDFSWTPATGAPALYEAFVIDLDDVTPQYRLFGSNTLESFVFAGVSGHTYRFKIRGANWQGAVGIASDEGEVTMP